MLYILIKKLSCPVKPWRELYPRLRQTNNQVQPPPPFPLQKETPTTANQSNTPSHPPQCPDTQPLLPLHPPCWHSLTLLNEDMYVVPLWTKSSMLWPKLAAWQMCASLELWLRVRVRDGEWQVIAEICVNIASSWLYNQNTAPCL